MWLTKIHGVQKTFANGEGVGVQGKADVCFKNSEVEITAEAIVFPVLLHELNKGVMDYLICRGLPSDVTESELKYIYSKADCYSYEIWCYFLAPALWDGLLSKEQVGGTEMPKVIKKLCEMDLNQLTNYFINIQIDLQNERTTSNQATT
jgi:hypothetical protein